VAFRQKRDRDGDDRNGDRRMECTPKLRQR
jgi:hypothetical protein